MNTGRRAQQSGVTAPLGTVQVSRVSEDAARFECLTVTVFDDGRVVATDATCGCCGGVRGGAADLTELERVDVLARAGLDPRSGGSR